MEDKPAEKTLWSLKLGEEMYWQDYKVIRVPGGWLFGQYVYESSLDNFAIAETLAFVPYNEEFKDSTAP